MRSVLLILCVILALSEAYHEKFHNFKLTHQRQYESPEEESYRFQVFGENMKKIEEHNAKFEVGLETYELGMNQFGDITDEEFVQQTSCLDMPQNLNITEDQLYKAPAGFKRPASVDWVARGVTTPIKNQRQCGSCWAFTTVETLESIYSIKNGKLLVLSPQNLVDCAKPWGTNGCHGGYMNKAYNYITDEGIMLESDYPYQAVEGSCKFNPKKSVMKVKGSNFVMGENALQDAIAAEGPVGVGVDASEWKLYKGGIFSPKKEFNKLTHGVVAVGYGTEGGVDYYLLRNSYGPTWGEKGFIRIVRNKDSAFGVADAAVLPVL